MLFHVVLYCVAVNCVIAGFTLFSREPAFTYCYLPPKPEGTSYLIGGCNLDDQNYYFCRNEPGRVVQQFMQVIYHCEENYTLPDGNMADTASAFCINRKWEPQAIVCERTTDYDVDIDTNTDTYYIGIVTDTDSFATESFMSSY